MEQINFDDWGEHHGDDHSKLNPAKKSTQKITKPKGDHHGDDHPKIKPLHLEDLLISSDEFWEKMIPRRGALKNFLTINKPQSPSCGRAAVIAEIVTICNELLATKLRK